MGRSQSVPKSDFGAPLQILLGKTHPTPSQLGSIRKDVGRPFDPMVSGQGGLHFVPRSVSKDSAFFQKGHLSLPGHVQQPRECKVSQLCHPSPPSSSGSCRRPQVQFGGGGGGICQPPMDGHHALVGSPPTKQKASLSHGLSYVGFKCMVAPVNKDVKTQVKNVDHTSQNRHVSELLGRINASSQVAPSFSHCFRFLLEQQQIDNAEILLALKKLGNVSRYEKPFKKLFAILQEKHVHPLQARVVDVAAALLSLNEISVAEARNAYAAVCLLPGFEGIRFSPILKSLKRIWNHSVQKYATFWDPRPILKKLQSTQPLTDFSVPELRNRLILLFRLLALHRGIDLARTQRSLSMVDGKFFILVQRKGWRCPRWEQIMQDSDNPALSQFGTCDG
jgi:hypothetical protein